MNEFLDCLSALKQQDCFEKWFPDLEQQLRYSLDTLNHGDLDKWKTAVANLPLINPGPDFSLGSTIRIGHPNLLTTEQQIELEQQLRQLCPWRKGPYELFGVFIDTEWRSDWKWKRIEHAIEPLTDKRVLDVGCGSGYHLWRMKQAGASFVLGIDPSLLFWQQYLCIKKYLQHLPVYFLPLKSEDIPERLSAFDSVFSMGVLYHRRSPLDHITELRNALRQGGQLILETLIIDSSGQNILFPSDRYAQMRNVFFLPSIDLLKQWLERLGFVDIKVIDKNQTSIEEQRVTPWVKAKSLADFLDPNNPSLTIEGYPAPLRATITAIKDSRFQ